MGLRKANKKDQRPKNPKYLYRKCTSGKVGYTSYRVAQNTAVQVSKLRNYGTQGVYKCKLCGEFHLYTIKTGMIRLPDGTLHKKEGPIEINAGGLNFVATEQPWSRRAPWIWRMTAAFPEFIPVQSTEAGSMAKWDCIVQAIQYVEAWQTGRDLDVSKWIEAAREYIAAQRALL